MDDEVMSQLRHFLGLTHMRKLTISKYETERDYMTHRLIKCTQLDRSGSAICFEINAFTTAGN